MNRDVSPGADSCLRRLHQFVCKNSKAVSEPFGSATVANYTCSQNKGLALCSSVATLLAILPFQPVVANVSDAPPGAIIYSREVPTREAQKPGHPGTPNFVQAAPQEIVTGVLSSTLTPLSDEATGQISAVTGAAGVTTASILSGQGNPLDPEQLIPMGLSGSGGESGPSLATFTTQVTGQVSGLISAALAAVPLAMPPSR